MKLLKIYFAVLLFSFLGSMQNQVLAQGPLGSWTREFLLDNTLVNGDYKATIEKNPVGPKYSLRIYKASDNSTISSCIIFQNTHFKRLAFTNGSSWRGKFFYFTVERQEYDSDQNRDISLEARKGKLDQTIPAGLVLNDTVEATESAYIQLESDGKLVIYSGAGGVPILQIIEPCKN
jgi:hypothetical protein